MVTRLQLEEQPATEQSLKGVLALRGPARLGVGKRTVRLPTKGLALLVYLAAEGPTRRERLSDLLWGHRQALQNLRVEIHRLRKTLSSHGIEPFTECRDPLELSADITTVEGSGLFGEGLEDVSSEFQDWLDRRRARSTGAQGPSFHEELANDLASRINAPFVIVAAGLPGSGRQALARLLAAKLDMPFIEGECGSSPAVRYVVPSESTDSSIASCIVSDERSVWVVERSHFGEDPDLVLQLRSRLPANRLRFVELPAINWWEVKQSLPVEVDFAEGAQLHLAAGGNRRYLEELLELRPKGGFRGAPPVPLRMRAAIALETRRLSPKARLALESLSVHRGIYTMEALQMLGAAEHLEELERNGWFTYVGSGWAFRHELARRLIEDQLQVGVKARVHATLAVQLGNEHALRAAEFHGQRASGRRLHQPSWLETRWREASEKPSTVAVAIGPELWLDEVEAEGTDVMVEGDEVLMSRTAATHHTSVVRFNLEDDTLLVRVRGRAHVEDLEARDFTGPAAALTVSVPGATAVSAHLCEALEPELAIDGALRLPTGTHFDYWLLTPAAGQLELSSRAHGVVLELKVNAYRPKAPPMTETRDQVVVEAYVLERGLEAGGLDDFVQQAPTHSHGSALVSLRGS